MLFECAFNCLEKIALLSDAKVPEDILEGVGGGDFAYDVCEVVEAFAEVLGEEVAGETLGEGGLDAEEGGAGGAEGLGVAGVAHDDGVALGKRAIEGRVALGGWCAALGGGDTAEERVAKCVRASSSLCGKGENPDVCGGEFGADVGLQAGNVGLKAVDVGGGEEVALVEQDDETLVCTEGQQAGGEAGALFAGCGSIE